MTRLSKTQKNKIKLGGFSGGFSKMNSLQKKYSQKKVSSINLSKTQQLVDKKIQENQQLLLKSQESTTTKYWKVANDVKTMDSFSLLVNLCICGIIMPIFKYSVQHPESIIKSRKDLTKENLKKLGEQIFRYLKSESTFIMSVFETLVKKHPTAVAYITNDFLMNPLGKILMRFQLFKGIANMLQHIQSKKEGLENTLLNVLGRCVFNYETLTAISYSFQLISDEYRVSLETYKDPVQKVQKITKFAGIFLTVMELILCGTRSSWCSYLQPVQRLTLVFPIFFELGDTLVKVIIKVKNEKNLGSKQLMMSIVDNLIKVHCEGKLRLRNERLFQRKSIKNPKKEFFSEGDKKLFKILSKEYRPKEDMELELQFY